MQHYRHIPISQETLNISIFILICTCITLRIFSGNVQQWYMPGACFVTMYCHYDIKIPQSFKIILFVKWNLCHFLVRQEIVSKG